MHGKDLLCHKEPAKATKIPPNFACLELVLYGRRELAQQFLGSDLDIEVDHADDGTTTQSSTGTVINNHPDVLDDNVRRVQTNQQETTQFY